MAQIESFVVCNVLVFTAYQSKSGAGRDFRALQHARVVIFKLKVKDVSRVLCLPTWEKAAYESKSSTDREFRAFQHGRVGSFQV